MDFRQDIRNYKLKMLPKKLLKILPSFGRAIELAPWLLISPLFPSSASSGICHSVLCYGPRTVAVVSLVPQNNIHYTYTIQSNISLPQFLIIFLSSSFQNWPRQKTVSEL